MTDESSKSVPIKRKARPNSRKEALFAIEPRLRELKASGTIGLLMELAYTTNQVGNLKVEFAQAPGSGECYVSVRENRKSVFTAYLDPEPPGEHLGGKVRVVWWERGSWETRLLG
jgi:hypothetical protein